MLPHRSRLPSIDNMNYLFVSISFHFFFFFNGHLCWACKPGTRTGLHWVHGAPIPAFEGACHADAGGSMCSCLQHNWKCRLIEFSIKSWGWKIPGPSVDTTFSIFQKINITIITLPSPHSTEPMHFLQISLTSYWTSPSSIASLALWFPGVGGFQHISAFSFAFGFRVCKVYIRFT